MSTTPPKPHLRYAELKEWLQANGVSGYKLRSLLTQGVIKPNYVGGGYAYYNADQIRRDVLDAMDGDCSRRPVGDVRASHREAATK